MAHDHALKTPLDTAPRPARFRWGTLVFVLMAAGAAGVLFVRSRREAAGAAATASASAASRPVPVTVALVQARDMPLYLDGLGNATPLATVTVRSQVDGRLERVLFKEGQTVHARDVLAEIDPRPFTIQLHQTEAGLARDQALLANARLALARNQALRADNLVTQQQLDDQQAQVNQYEAALRGDQAQIENARLSLDYARVRAPITGVTGVRLVDPGNIVRASDPTGLVVITQLDPMAITFNLPQDDLVKVNRALAKHPLRVEVSNRDGSQPLAVGELALIDNQINQATATAKLKAIVPNPERLLWPNQFVKVRLQLETRRGALVIPATAVQRGPDGSYAYVVGNDGTAVLRHLELELLQDDLAIVKSGVSPGERVVVEGQTQLKPNSKVAARPAATATPQGTRRERGTSAEPAQANGAPSASEPAGSARAPSESTAASARPARGRP